MKRDFQTIQWKEFYSTGKDNLADDFYGPAIERACLIERAVGYFRSTAYLLLYTEFCDFLKNNGRLRIICSPKMHFEDIRVLGDATRIDRAEVDDSGSQLELLDQIAALKATENGSLHIQLLAGMLKFNLLEIKIALTSDGEGIFHEKLGVLHDEDSRMLSFSGSANETLCGWGINGNVESFDVFREWIDTEKSRVKNHHEAFMEAWEGRRPGVTTADLDTAVKDKLLEEAPEDKDELIRLVRSYQKLNKDLLRNQRRAPSQESQESDEWPSGRQAEPHQRSALDSWYENKSLGIFKHATGSGKTFTGLHAIRDHIRTGKVVIVVVPSELLFSGWRAELSQEIPNATILLAGAGHTEWKTQFRIEAFTGQTDSESRHIILATMQTASSPKFYRRLKNPSEILIVADEVHQLGSTENSKLMTKPFGKRLGLSATPERYGDAEGTNNLLSYFDGVVGGEFTLADALKAGRLVPYNYHPMFVYLNEEERDRWAELTKKIRRLAAASPKDSNGNISPSLSLKKQLINRSRIAKKANAKVRTAVAIIKEHYFEGNHWLVYCEDQNQVSDVLEGLRAAGLDPMTYHSSMSGDRERTLKHYIDNGGVMVAIRCLDEGVDIPCISHAIILASSQNPRQFIQRRGRVLRKADFKSKAEIWDMLVMPLEDDEENESVQDTLTRAELLRALEFGEHAMNQHEISDLRKKAIEMDLDFTKVYPAQEEDIQEDESV